MEGSWDGWAVKGRVGAVQPPLILPSPNCPMPRQHWDLASRMGPRMGSLHLRELRFVSILHEEYT